MVDNLQKSIDRFTNYFTKQINDIEGLTSDYAELYRRLLYASLIDTLAGTVMPYRPNRERFVQFVKRFCKWPDGERVSLTHLLLPLMVKLHFLP